MARRKTTRRKTTRRKSPARRRTTTKRRRSTRRRNPAMNDLAVALGSGAALGVVQYTLEAQNLSNEQIAMGMAAVSLLGGVGLAKMNKTAAAGVAASAGALAVVGGIKAYQLRQAQTNGMMGMGAVRANLNGPVRATLNGYGAPQMGAVAADLNGYGYAPVEATLS